MNRRDFFTLDWSRPEKGQWSESRASDATGMNDLPKNGDRTATGGIFPGRKQRSAMKKEEPCLSPAVIS